MGVGMDLMRCGPEEFPVSNVAMVISTGEFHADTLSQPPTFLDIEFQKYLFRNRLAQQFANAISASQSRKKMAFSFNMVCNPNDFMTIVKLKEEPFVELKTKGGSNAKMLTHDSIFQLKTPAAEVIVEFESVEPLFKLLESFFYFWPLTS